MLGAPFSFFLPFASKSSHYRHCTMSTQNDRLKMIRAVCRSFPARKLARDIFYVKYGNCNV